MIHIYWVSNYLPRRWGRASPTKLINQFFEAIHRHNLCIWLHQVFDNRKPGNNIVFSWEYELSQAMMQLVQVKIFDKYPNIKIIVHHAGTMVPFLLVGLNTSLGTTPWPISRSSTLTRPFWATPAH